MELEITIAALFGLIVYAFLFAVAFGLGIAAASRILPVITKREVTYDNLDKN